MEELDPMIVCTVGREALKAVSLIEEHDLNKKQLSQVSEKEVIWFGRILFPLYHTGTQARNGPTGRDEKLQRMDWQKLRESWKRLKEMHCKSS
jgi:uracil-DNA glycosylase